MKHLVGFRVYQEDKLVIRWTGYEGDIRRDYSQGKRISAHHYKRFPWVREMTRIYVKQGVVKAVKFIRYTTGWSILESKLFLDSIRFF
jgi:hypothetical protein